RPAERALTELARDALGARLLVLMARRVAREDTVAARRRAHAGRTVRTADLEAADPEHAVLAAAGHEHLLLVVGFGERAALERDANLVRTGRRREANVLEPRVDLLHDAVLDLVVGADVFLATERGLVDGRAIERNDDGVLELRIVGPDVREEVRNIDLVLAVGREQMRHDHAAARAERQTRDVRLLVAGACGVGLAARARRRLTDGTNGYGTRRDHVLLDERR